MNPKCSTFSFAAPVKNLIFHAASKKRMYLVWKIMREKNAVLLPPVPISEISDLSRPFWEIWIILT